ncbi:hypothetical protein NIES2100_04930 [Calothrix sp. NIES-2100]|nr:hypothetical protein NIES2100_04930 [Calothrix sp. NIES-2100]
MIPRLKLFDYYIQRKPLLYKNCLVYITELSNLTDSEQWAKIDRPFSTARHEFVLINELKEI